MNRRLLTVIIFIVTTIHVKEAFAGFTYTSCGLVEPKAAINSINVTNCDPNDAQLERCIFKKGQNVTISTSFTTSETLDDLKVKITGVIYGVPIPWNVSPDNACSYGLTCPITKDVENNFVMTMPINKIYPTLSVLVKLRLEDSNKKPVVCIQFPARIQN